MQAIIVGLICAVTTMILPTALITSQERPLPEPVVMIIEENSGKEYILLDTGEEIERIEMDEYLIGVVMSEMPAEFDIEALKAQAVAARTFALHKSREGKHRNADLCADPSCCQAWSSVETLEKKYGDSFQKYKNKVKMAVDDTAGEVLKYEGELIEAVYFSCSGGKTEPAVAVWGTDVPYLQSVISAGEETAEKFQSTVCVDLEEFRTALQKENPAIDLDCDKSNWITAINHSTGGGITEIEIGGQAFSGTDIRRIFGLNSTRFSVKIDEKDVLFEVTGYGHRVGMSQYGAEAMARTGADYRQILEHYYFGANVDRT